MYKVPLQVFKEFEHQVRLNLCTLNFRLLSLRLHLTAIPPSENARTVSRLLSKELKAKFKRVPILKKQPDMVMKRPVTI